MRRIFHLLVVSCLGGCVTTQDFQMAPNMVRIDTSAQGRLWVGKAGDATLFHAAEVTKKNGYELFKFADVQTGNGVAYGGQITTASSSVYANPYNAYGTAGAISTPLFVETSKIGATVIMFHRGEPGSAGAFDAQTILDKGVQ